MPEIRHLSLVKLPHRFAIDYEVGQESAVLDELVAMVHNIELPFDWFDAAVLSHQMGQHLAGELVLYKIKGSPP